jgi:DNA-binding MarR family transcriptional regulator
MTATVETPAPTSSESSAPPGPRAVALLTRVRSITNERSAPQTAVLAALVSLVLDAILAADQPMLVASEASLRTTVNAARRRARSDGSWAEAVGWLEVLATLATEAADRLPSPTDFRAVPAGSRAHEMLKLLRRNESLRQKDVASQLGMQPSEVSRLASELEGQRLVARSKIGREVFLDITPHAADLLDDIETRKAHEQRRQRRRIRTRLKDVPVLHAATGAPFELREESIRAALEQTSRIATRSRALFVALASHRPEVIRDRLLLWDSLTQYAPPARMELFLPAPAEPDTQLERQTWEVLAGLDRPEVRERAEWPGPAPLWDGWAIVHGENKRRGLVLLEAKSQPDELRNRPTHRLRKVDTTAWEEVLGDTSRYLEADQPWRLWPDYADAAARLAFLHRLQQLNIPVWWLNLYFVDPQRRLSRLPRSTNVWESRIKAVRNELAIEDVHKLTRYIRHEFVPVPEEGFALVV